MNIWTSVYCTLFDSMYADKGLVMIQSLRTHNKDSEIYVLCMDDKCYSIVRGEKIEQVIAIRLGDFIDEELRVVKGKRSKGEFCWSCTAKLIKYVLKKSGASCCTYIDSDLFFYSNPDILVGEMINNGCVVQVIPHRFPNKRRWRAIEKQSGKNCVQFNTFTNQENSRELLDTWIRQCMKKCDKDSGGDQLYTSDWGSYSFVNVSQNDGAGLAPWNVESYKVCPQEKRMIKRKKDSKLFKLIFFHFQGLEYNSRYEVNVHIRNKFTHVDQKLIDELYIPYLLRLEKMKSRLESEYEVVPLYSHSIGLFGNENKRMGIKERVSRLIERKNTKKDTYDIKELIERRVCNE